MLITFSVEMTPIPQGSFRYIGNGRMISANPKLNAWREAVGVAAALVTDERLITDPVEVTIDFYFSRPKSVKREYMTVTPDVDKLIRSSLDAISLDRFCRLLKSDAQVIKVTATKQYSDDGSSGAIFSIVTK